MTPTDKDIDDDEEGSRWWNAASGYLNFYRIHVLYYVFTPLIFSGIFYASNGRYHISYIDSLFNCVSAMTVCGLATVNLSSLTGWQQAILFIQMCIGNPIVISWLVVYQRRRYFAVEFENILKARAEEKASAASAEGGHLSQWPTRISTLIHRSGRRTASDTINVASRNYQEDRNGKSVQGKVRPDMIRRVDEEPRLINPSGFAVPSNRDSDAPNVRLSFALPLSTHGHHGKMISTTTHSGQTKRIRRVSDPGLTSRPGSPLGRNFPPMSDTIDNARTVSLDIPRPTSRSQTIEFAPSAIRHRAPPIEVIPEGGELPEWERPQAESLQYTDHPKGSTSEPRTSVSHPPSAVQTSRVRFSSQSAKNRGFGFFAITPAFTTLFARLFPKLGRKLTRTMTIPATTSLISHHAEASRGAKAVSYISFAAVVGPNSAFHDLSHEEREELGGVEYRALNGLLWIIAGYHIATQLVAFTVIAPYISTARWKDNFTPPIEIRPVDPLWFSIFQCVSAYTNTGMSLVDTSMTTFQMAYPMLFLLAFLILAGNTAFPIFLRFTIWTMTKVVAKGSRAKETLHFLLDHPRRCYILLFPSHQTWFLLTVVSSLTITGWFSFLVLGIGNHVVEKIPLGTRFAVGFFQSTAVRSAGFSAVSIAGLTAGLKVLFVVMMYISVYPIAMSIRSTNVYEEQSLGIFPEEGPLDEEDFEHSGPRIAVWSRYLAMHARRQLAFDMWWLGLALFFLCIIEKNRLDDPSDAVWFNIFSIVFDLVSAYGTVGLSLGVPFDSYSFAGALQPLSKLILCLVMIRGRHRGLPMAIDRAVMLPSEFQRSLDKDDRSQYAYRSSSAYIREGDHDDSLSGVALATKNG